MKIRRPLALLFYYILICLLTGIYSCKPEVAHHTCHHKLLAILAHPDDETLISGTLAKLEAEGSDVTIAYVTSGDDGEDLSGRELWG